MSQFPLEVSDLTDLLRFVSLSAATGCKLDAHLVNIMIQMEPVMQYFPKKNRDSFRKLKWIGICCFEALKLVVLGFVSRVHVLSVLPRLGGGALVQARNFAVMTGVNEGISCVMKRIRGNMVAAFGSGATFSLASGLGGPNQAANVVMSGLFFALFQGALFKVRIYLVSF